MSTWESKAVRKSKYWNSDIWNKDTQVFYKWEGGYVNMQVENTNEKQVLELWYLTVNGYMCSWSKDTN